LLLLVLPLAACGGSGSHATPTTSSGKNGCSKVADPTLGSRTERKPSSILANGMTYDVVMKTNCGTFAIQLDPKESPHAVASFVALAKDGYFDRTTFYRIVPGLMIEGGDPTATGTGGPGYSTLDRPPTSATYAQGVVAMTRIGARVPGTAGSRFFIVTATDARLPPDYAIIGTVTRGFAVIERIGVLGGGTDLPNQVQNTSGTPTEIVEIEDATVVTS
jgi:cyclophilin family peptidyl-prolyl cis-trans isomerase